MDEIKLQELYIKIININNVLRALGQEDVLLSEDDWNLLKIILKT